MIEIPLNLPPGAALALVAAVIACAAGFSVAKLLARLRRVEENTGKHEEMCEERHRKINDALVALYESQSGMREDIAYIKARISGGEE